MSATRIEITEADKMTVTEFGGKTTKRQPATVITGRKYGLPITLRIDEDESAYKPGNYQIAGSSFKIGEYGLEIGKPILTQDPDEVASVEFESDEIEEFEFEGRKIRRQPAILRMSKRHGLPFNLKLNDDEEPYKPGVYEIDGKSIKLGSYGKLAIERKLVLVPRARAAAQAQPQQGS